MISPIKSVLKNKSRVLANRFERLNTTVHSFKVMANRRIASNTKFCSNVMKTDPVNVNYMDQIK